MKELTLPAVRENIPAVIDFINRELKNLGCPVKTEAQIDIAIDEIYSNIASYGYDGESGEVVVRLETEIQPRVVVISFIDKGRPFNPLGLADPDVTLSARERKIGGLGIFMVRKLADEVTYEYADGKNILKIRKKYG